MLLTLLRLLPDLYAPADKAFLLPREPGWAAAVNDRLRPAPARGARPGARGLSGTLSQRARPRVQQALQAGDAQVA